MKTITREELASQETPGDGWYVIEAAGDHPHRYPDENGQELEFMLHVPPEVLEAVAGAGVPEDGLLVDKDHLSHDLDKSTEAYGWVRELAVCEGDLAARIEWTPLGRPLVEGKVYKHFSTEYGFSLEEARSGSVSPTRLIGLALTNRPCNKEGQPSITSREGGDHLNPGYGCRGEDKKEPNKEKMNAEILAELGLPETATDEEVLNAIKDLKTATNAAEQAEVETLVSAEESANEVELTEEEKKEVIEELLTNRSHGEKYLKLLCSSKAGERKPTGRTYPDRSGRAAQPATKTVNPNEKELLLISRAEERCREAKKAGKHLGFRVAYAEVAREANAK